MNEPWKSGWIQTFTGKRMYPLDPKAADIDIVDIAHALANKCRYSGHTSSFYSVAQHSVLVARRLAEMNLPRMVVLQGLLHDATEAYLPDVARPIKKQMPGFEQIEQRVHDAVAEHFGLENPFDPLVKQCDLDVLFYERRDLMRDADGWTAGSTDPGWGIGIFPRDPRAAEFEFLAHWKFYKKLAA